MLQFNKTTMIKDNAKLERDLLPTLETISIDSSSTTCTSLSMLHQLPPLSTVNEEEEEEEEREEKDCTTIDEDDDDAVSENFYDTFELGPQLGSGGYGTVHQCTFKKKKKNRRDQGESSLAVKIVNAENYDHEEIEILDVLMGCPNVTRVLDLYHDEEEAFIVMEEMKGGDLLDRLQERRCAFTEADAKIIMRTVLETLRFCHSKGIVHCDIKPENILLRHKDNDVEIQLADFGLAQRFKDHHTGARRPLFHRVGTVEYMAPEIMMCDEEGYDELVDVWSAGCLLYIILGGYAPFDEQDEDELMEQICAGSFYFHKPYWTNVSQEAKDLVTMMLEVNPEERISVDDALNSEWFHSSASS